MLATAVAALALSGTLGTVATASPAGAALSTVGGSCGFHLGTPLVTGALGTFGFEFPAFPANPHQVCSVTVSGTAALNPVAPPAYTNVAGNHGSASFTLDFTGGPLPPGILWLWQPHCADPAAAGVVSLTVDGQSASSPVQPAQSCNPDFGGHSSLSFDSVDPDFSWYAVGLAGTTDNLGYWGATAAGDVRAVGGAAAPGAILMPAAPVVGAVADPSGGVWVVAADGGVFALGGATFFGSLGGIPLNAPVVGMAATPDGGGYWLVAADGGVFCFGDAVVPRVDGRHTAQRPRGGYGLAGRRRVLAGGERRRRVHLRRCRLPRFDGWDATQCPRGGHRLAGCRGLLAGRL